jgi:trk system potassium uptake protein
MNLRAVFHLISFLLFFISAGIFVSWGISWIYQDAAAIRHGMLLSALLSTLLSAALWAFTRGPIDLTRRDGFGIVTFGWLSVAHVGALPYLLTGALNHPIDAVFETMSGFTATGSTTFLILEGVPYGILFWRSLTQWFGGMGIIVLAVAILPFLGVGGMQLFSAEMSGPSKDRLTPRIESTAKLLWAVYLLLTLASAIAFRLCGMNTFDAVCHAFTCAATGGFSTRTASIAAYDSVAIETVFIIFMLLSAMSFPLHFRALTGKPIAYWRDSQTRFYLGCWLGMTLLIAGNLMFSLDYSAGQSLRDAAFQVATLISSTGYISADYDQWPALSRFLLLILMIVGGCAGSTAGGLKIIRVHVLMKKAIREVRLFVRPHAVVQVKTSQKTIPQEIISKITSYFVIYMFIWVLGTALMTAFLPDVESAFSAVITALSNMGPGFGTVGAVQNFADVNPGGKIVLTLMMLLGRLELYTVLVLFLPSFWRK